MAMSNALQRPIDGFQIKGPTGSDRDATTMCPTMPPSRHDRSHQIPRAKAIARLRPHQRAPWKALRRDPGALVRPTSGGGDPQDLVWPGGDVFHLTHTERIEGMSFRNPEPVPIPLCAPAGSKCNWKFEPVERLIQCPPGTIHRCRIVERLFGLRL